MNTTTHIIQVMNIGEGVPYPCRVQVEKWPDGPVVYLLIDPRTDEVFWLCRSCHMKAHRNERFLDGLTPVVVPRSLPSPGSPAPDAGRGGRDA